MPDCRRANAWLQPPGVANETPVGRAWHHGSSLLAMVEAAGIAFTADVRDGVPNNNRILLRLRQHVPLPIPQKSPGGVQPLVELS